MVRLACQTLTLKDMYKKLNLIGGIQLMKRIKRSTGVCLILVVFLILIFTLQVFAEPEYKWRFAMPWNRKLASQSYQLFSDLVGVYSNGRIEIEYFDNALLGSLGENFHAIQAGDIELGASYTYANLVPKGMVAQMPYTIRDYDELAITSSAPDGILYKITNKAWEEVGFHLLFISPSTFIGLANNVRPLKTPDDLKDLKFRVSGSVQCVEMLRNLGKGTGMTMETLPWADIYNALERGVMDGIWTSYSSLIEERHFEVVKYFTDLRFWPDVTSIVINKEIWDELPDDLKNAIAKAAKMAEERTYEVYRRAEREYRDILVDAGLEIYPITEEERSLWIEKADPTALWQQLAKPLIDELYPGENMTEKILEEINDMRK